MTDIERVLVRLRVDSDFRKALSDDPSTALEPYELNNADLRRLDRAVGRQGAPSLRALLNPEQAEPSSLEGDS